MDPQLPMAAVVREANKAMGLEPAGSLPEQAESLLLTMGAEIPAPRPIPIRKVRESPADQKYWRSSGTGEPPTAAEGMSDRGRSPRASGESVSSGASPLNSPLALERKKKKRPPPKFILDDPEYVVADAPAGERPAHARRPREPIVYAAPADAARALQRHVRSRMLQCSESAGGAAAKMAAPAAAGPAPPPPPPPDTAPPLDGVPWHLRPESCATGAKPAAARSSSAASSSLPARPEMMRQQAPGGSRGAAFGGGALEFGGRPFNQGIGGDRFGGDSFKFKTRLCSTWRERGRCTLGSACKFAHGEQELVYMSGGPTEREFYKQELLFKTRICRHWQLSGSCYHGRNCQFAHGEGELKARPGRGPMPGGSAPTPVCLCLKSFSGCRLYPVEATGSHAVRPGETSGPIGSQITSLLGSLSNFCATFYHANSWEANVKLCLHWPADAGGARKLAYHELSNSQKESVRRCSKSQVGLIARLVRTGDSEPLYVARYANCFRGNTECNVHAEEFMFSDSTLQDKINALSGGPNGKRGDGSGKPVQLLLYMTYQPCHHSGGALPRDELARAAYMDEMAEHATSCSERLRDWYLSVLVPQKVELQLILSDVYKATWENSLHPTMDERKAYASKSSAAREGLRMLLREGIEMRSMQPADWDFLVSLCDRSVQIAWSARGSPGSPFSRLQLDLRARMDSYLESYIHECKVDRAAQPSTLGIAAADERHSTASYRVQPSLDLLPAVGGSAVTVSLSFAPGRAVRREDIARSGPGNLQPRLDLLPAVGGSAVTVSLSFAPGRVVRREDIARSSPGDCSSPVDATAATARDESSFPSIQPNLIATSASTVCFRIRVCARN